MSWHYLQGQEAAFWEGPSLDGAPSALLSLIPTPAESCSPVNATDGCHDSQFGTMSKPSAGDRGEAPLTSCPEGFLAKTFPALEEGQELKASEVGCGNTWRELSARFDRVTSGWRTHRCLFDAALQWSSVTLPRWGMMRSGVLWERATPGLLTSGTGFGFWPTPNASDNRPRATQASTDRRRAIGKQISLEAEVKWPTPTARNAKECNAPSESNRNTPTLAAQVGGQLNPAWVEWLMGWPIGWTDCAASATDKSPRPWPWRGQS